MAIERLLPILHSHVVKPGELLLDPAGTELGCGGVVLAGHWGSAQIPGDRPTACTCRSVSATDDQLPNRVQLVRYAIEQGLDEEL